MPVQRHGCFQTKRITGAKPAADHALILSRLKQKLPQPLCLFCRKIKLKSILSRITCSGYNAFDPVYLTVKFAAVILFRNHFLRYKPPQNHLRLWALKSNLRCRRRNIRKCHIAECVILHPRKVLILICRINNNKIMILSDLINDQIIHYASMLITHRTIPRLSVIHGCIIICQQIVKIFHGIAAFTQDLSHVRYIKHTTCSSNCHMLRDHTGLILHRKQIPCKGYDFSFVLYMRFIQRCF